MNKTKKLKLTHSQTHTKKYKKHMNTCFTDVHIQDPVGEERHEEIFCQVCFHFLTEPYEHNGCGKLICGSCLNIRLGENKDACPFCKTKMALGASVFYSKKAEQFVMNLKIVCFHDKCKKTMDVRGAKKHLEAECLYEPRPCVDCKNVIKYVELKEHQTVCASRPVNCPSCLCVLKAHELGNHQQKECLERSVECSLCSKEMKFKEVKSHHLVCPNRMKFCDMCRAPIVLSKLEKHKVDECLQRKVPCVSCHAQLKYVDMDTHVGLCPERVVKCMCGKEMKKKDLANHILADCPEQIMNCPHREWSKCVYHCERKNMGAHSDDKDGHIEMCKEVVRKLEDERESFKKVIQSVHLNRNQKDYRPVKYGLAIPRAEYSLDEGYTVYPLFIDKNFEPWEMSGNPRPSPKVEIVDISLGYYSG